VSEYERVLQTEFSGEFVKGMQDRMVMSYYKYGPVKVNYEQKLINNMESLEKRLQKYKDTGNTEYLIDVANFAMIEFMYPQHKGAFYKATDSSESPGVVGMSIKEIEAFQEE
jgi:hypothetical protein